MHFAAELLPQWWQFLSVALGLMCLLTALRGAKWRALVSVPERVHLVAGGAVCTALLWLLNVRLSGDVTVHILGVTTLTLVLGWHFALLAGLAALLVFYATGDQLWSAFPSSFLLTVVVPSTVSAYLARALYRPDLKHLFVYILGSGFAGGALVVLVLACLGVGLLAVAGHSDLYLPALEVWPLVVLMMFSEGFINGMCVSALAIFYPQWVMTFDETFYLDDT